MPEGGRVGGLGRIHVVDARDQNFSMAAHLVDTLPTTPLPVKKTWRSGPVLDQGDTPHCVGYAGAQSLMTQELNRHSHRSLTSFDETGDSLYYECKVIDGEPTAEDGSSARSLMQALANRGLLVKYVWASSPAEIQNWLLSTGPVLMGVPWHEQMDRPDPHSGLVGIGGGVRGGHEFEMQGVDTTITKGGFGLAHGPNSWGVDWGKAGRFWIYVVDLFSLMQEGGDCCAPVYRP